MASSDFPEVYTYQVSLWIPGNDDPRSIFEKGNWVEYARCHSRSSAEEVALCLSLRHPKGVMLAELVQDAYGGRHWQEFKFLPESAVNLVSGRG